MFSFRLYTLYDISISSIYIYICVYTFYITFIIQIKYIYNIYIYIHIQYVERIYIYTWYFTIYTIYTMYTIYTIFTIFTIYTIYRIYAIYYIYIHYIYYIYNIYNRHTIYTIDIQYTQYIFWWYHNFSSVCPHKLCHIVPCLRLSECAFGSCSFFGTPLCFPAPFPVFFIRFHRFSLRFAADAKRIDQQVMSRTGMGSKQHDNFLVAKLCKAAVVKPQVQLRGRLHCQRWIYHGAHGSMPRWFDSPPRQGRVTRLDVKKNIWTCMK